MHPMDEEKTAFMTERSCYCYKVPFGLKNAGATYQRLMDKVLAPMLGRNVQAYVDDMVVTSLEKSRHVADMEELFVTIAKYKLKLNPEKCIFSVEAGKFLGFLLTKRGIEANPDKCAAILAMRSPATVKEVQQLTGRMTALSRFVSTSGEKGFAIAPLVVGADGLSGGTRMNYHLVIMFLAERKVSLITFLEVKDVDVGVDGRGLTQQSRSSPGVQPFVVRKGFHSRAGLRWGWLRLVGSRGHASHGLARRATGIPWWIARRGRVDPTSFRRRVLRRWRRVWSDFGASHQKNCKEEEKGKR